MTPITRKARKRAIITGILSLMLLFIPLIVFVSIGFYKTDTTGKVCISFIGIATLVLTFLMAVMKAKLKRTVFWLILIGVYIGFRNMKSVIICMAICNIVDEVIVTPIHIHYKAVYKTNKILDDREEANRT